MGNFIPLPVIFREEGVHNLLAKRGKNAFSLIFTFIFLLLPVTGYHAVHDPPDENHGFTVIGRGGPPFTDIGIVDVVLDKTTAVRRETVTFFITLKNRGDTIHFEPTVIRVRAVSGRTLLVEEAVELGGWDILDRMKVILRWDTSNFPSGMYRVKIEAPHEYDADRSDNSVTVSDDIIIR
jgi:hypothetical protein